MKVLIFDHILLHLAPFPLKVSQVWLRGVLEFVIVINAVLCVPAAFFMEHWKRRQMCLNYEWDLTGFEDEEVWSHDTLTLTYDTSSLEVILLVCHLMLSSSSSPGVCRKHWRFEHIQTLFISFDLWPALPAVFSSTLPNSPFKSFTGTLACAETS